MERNTWYTVKSEKSKEDLFFEVINQFQRTEWNVESYQNPSEIQSDSARVLIQGLNESDQVEVVIVRYAPEKPEIEYEEPIPVIITNSSDSSSVHTIGKQQFNDLYPQRNNITDQIWSKLTNCLESSI